MKNDHPTWNDPIKGYFTQTDIDHMKQERIDLSSYDAVKTNGERIYRAVSSGFMPPASSKEPKWSATRVSTFKQWMDAGYPQG